MTGSSGKLRRPKPKKALVASEEDGGGIDWGDEHGTDGADATEVDVGDSKRFEKISEMIKSFRIFLQK